ncbi:MAG: TonB-dependent receptor, partial [Bacteroidota bacterium]|nr:TonB-dependent receptor [Bacteroidota bacterium]
MKKSFKFKGMQIADRKLMLLAIVLSIVSRTYAQEKTFLTGKLVDQKTNQAVPYANVSLEKVSDSSPMSSSISDTAGIFFINPIPKCKYKLSIKIIGYEPEIRIINLENESKNDVGTIYLQNKDIKLKETVITGERPEARPERGKTTFYVTQKMLDATNTGTDVLRLIPGIQIDIMQNISLEGNPNILILVDGKERDRHFIAQLNSNQIEKIEVISVPPSSYDARVTGAINIILKKERDYGLNGQIFAEIPTNGSEIYIFPNYSLNYGFKKLNLYTSYNGEMSYFDIHECTKRKEWNNTDFNEIISNQYVRQMDWSHRFHYGFDYFLSSRDQLNFYAFFNPYSQEHNGTANLQLNGKINRQWEAKKEDTDINTGSLYSLFYRHIFNKKGQEITLDISNYRLKAENKTDYIDESRENNSAIRVNEVKPRQNVASIKIDFVTPLSDKFVFNSGIKGKFQVMQDRYSNSFKYNENIYAVYATATYNKNSRYEMNTGLRVENFNSTLKSGFNHQGLSFFPYVSVKYKLTGTQNIQFSCNRSIIRPNIYQLDPSVSIDDPYTVRKGNPALKPEFRNSLYIEHSILFRGNYFSSRLFYNRLAGVINNLTFINDTNSFESQMQNLGTIHQYGLQFSGSLKLGIATFNPYLRLYDIYTAGNSLARQYSIGDRHNPVIESSISAVLSFKYGMSLSLTFQYASKKNNIQDNYFCDALYFLTFEKTFRQKIKVGLVSGIP